jgi:hypothetical protein
MAIEILLERDKTFHHHLRNDLESVLFVIVWICSHMEGPGVERKDVADLYTVPFRSIRHKLFFFIKKNSDKSRKN